MNEKLVHQCPWGCRKKDNMNTVSSLWRNFEAKKSRKNEEHAKIFSLRICGILLFLVIEILYFVYNGSRFSRILSKISYPKNDQGQKSWATSKNKNQLLGNFDARSDHFRKQTQARLENGAAYWN